MRSANLLKAAFFIGAIALMTMAPAAPSLAQISGSEQGKTTQKKSILEKKAAPKPAEADCQYSIRNHKACPTGKAQKKKCTGDKSWQFIRCY